MCKVGSTAISLLRGLLLASNPFYQAAPAVFMVHEILQHKILLLKRNIIGLHNFPLKNLFTMGKFAFGERLPPKNSFLPEKTKLQQAVNFSHLL